MADKKTDNEPPKLWLARALLWADNPKTPGRIFQFLIFTCAALVLTDFIVGQRYDYFYFDGITGFYGIYGFSAFVFVVFAGILLRKLIKRDEDYYDR